MLDQPPVIVIGAGRSGTNLLREVICSFEGFDTWPCDEINYIWRHGNRDSPTDELQPADARPEVKRFLTRAFATQERRQGGGTVVEKTCANSLRVAFVHEVFPDARFVYIVRDGRDVVASAIKRWTAPLDIPYLARKVRFVPPADLPYYAARYFGSRLKSVGSPDRRVTSWGPRFFGMADMINEPLAALCAIQWRRCVEFADQQHAESVGSDRVHRLRYEDLVNDPDDEVRRLAAFLDMPVPSPARLPLMKPGAIGRWRRDISATDQALVESVIAETLVSRGYQ